MYCSCIMFHMVALLDMKKEPVMIKWVVCRHSSIIIEVAGALTRYCIEVHYKHFQDINTLSLQNFKTWSQHNVYKIFKFEKGKNMFLTYLTKRCIAMHWVVHFTLPRQGKGIVTEHWHKTSIATKKGKFIFHGNCNIFIVTCTPAQCWFREFRKRQSSFHHRCSNWQNIPNTSRFSFSAPALTIGEPL